MLCLFQEESALVFVSGSTQTEWLSRCVSSESLGVLSANATMEKFIDEIRAVRQTSQSQLAEEQLADKRRESASGSARGVLGLSDGEQEEGEDPMVRRMAGRRGRLTGGRRKFDGCRETISGIIVRSKTIMMLAKQCELWVERL